MNRTSFGSGLPPGAPPCAAAGCTISNPVQAKPMHQTSLAAGFMIPPEVAWFFIWYSQVLLGQYGGVSSSMQYDDVRVLLIRLDLADGLPR